MQPFIDSPPLSFLWKASWQAAVLILLVLAAQRVFRRRLSPRWRYGLWLLVAFRLALPWTAPSRVSVFNFLSFRGSPLGTAGNRTNPTAQSSASAPSASLAQPAPVAADSSSRLLASDSTSRPVAAPPWLGSLFPLLLVLWSVGALSLALCVLANHFRLSRKFTRRRPLIHAPVLNLLEDCKQLMHVRVPVTLIETPEVGSPALFGFVRPRLLLPAGMTRSFSLDELRCVFLHELGHIKRHDILFGWLATALQVLHWFNPLVWLAFHRMRLDRELACDALALGCVQGEENHLYGQTIIKLLESFGRPAWAPSLVGIVENKNQMKERIRMIANLRKTNRGLALAAVLFAGLGLITLTDAQPGSFPLPNDLIGTWVLVGSPGAVGKPPPTGGRLKFLTGTHWCDTQADPKTGAVMFHHGGTYTLNGNDYAQTTDYANPSTANLIGKTGKFTIKLEGDTLTLIGIGNPWKEVWKRAASDSPKPQKAEPATLQGTWGGHEIGASDKNAASLIVKGSSFEFHGANTNEWYKATFSVFDTTPKQLVIEITDCPFPEYAGKTSYALYELKEGKLTITGNEPGNPVAPSGFDAPGARKFVFQKE
ncbi:MAG TPA: M56 family metallopeptidase [Candidatus Acidoferrum sp.]|jgi:beta-lactamase regulating signal transducer with metallopeptidase domain|nr:M56 family metallopeptidase [Candidatus Acidoferrum sp.]